jgi:uncharacterized membrane protein YeaQ/YmgE (transglycosylase-associated protein family)
MHLIFALVIGFFIGILARFLMPGKNPQGLIVTSLLGITGSLFAAFLGQSMGLYRPGEPAGFLSSVIGAMLLLFIYHLVRNNRS